MQLTSRVTRRDLGPLAAGAVAMTAMPWLAAASESNGWEQAIIDFTGGAEPAEGGVTLDTPEIAENGYTVPLHVSAPGALAILVVATDNPDPRVVTFEFSALSGDSAGSTRIRLARSQNVIAVAKLADGRYARATRNVHVTIGGCGV